MNPITALQRRFTSACDVSGYTLLLMLKSTLWLKVTWRKRSEVVYHTYTYTFGAMPITFVVSAFIGMILALQTGMELKNLGAENTIGFLVSAAITREMGPIMTAFALAGLIGSTIAAELGTMKVSEEIDALEVMSIDPIRYLVMPRTLALALVCPILTIYGDAIGILCGGLVGHSLLGIDYSIYFNNAADALKLKDVFGGLIKSYVFGLIIGGVGCAQGMRAKNGAEGVGQATLKSVVISFIFVLVFDYMMSWFIYGQ